MPVLFRPGEKKNKICRNNDISSTQPTRPAVNHLQHPGANSHWWKRQRTPLSRPTLWALLWWFKSTEHGSWEQPQYQNQWKCSTGGRSPINLGNNTDDCHATRNVYHCHGNHHYNGYNYNPQKSLNSQHSGKPLIQIFIVFAFCLWDFTIMSMLLCN